MPITWYDYVLSEFPGEEAIARVTLVEDPDTLLADEAIFAKLNERRYRVVAVLGGLWRDPLDKAE